MPWEVFPPQVVQGLNVEVMLGGSGPCKLSDPSTRTAWLLPVHTFHGPHTILFKESIPLVLCLSLKTTNLETQNSFPMEKIIRFFPDVSLAFGLLSPLLCSTFCVNPLDPSFSLSQGSSQAKSADDLEHVGLAVKAAWESPPPTRTAHTVPSPPVEPKTSDLHCALLPITGTSSHIPLPQPAHVGHRVGA